MAEAGIEHVAWRSNEDACRHEVVCLGDGQRVQPCLFQAIDLLPPAHKGCDGGKEEEDERAEMHAVVLFLCFTLFYLCLLGVGHEVEHEGVVGHIDCAVAVDVGLRFECFVGHDVEDERGVCHIDYAVAIGITHHANGR